MSEPSPQAEGGTEQPLIAHLLELRDRVVRMLLGVGLVFIPLAIFARDIYGFLAKPLMALMPLGTSMIATDVASPFFAPFKLAAVLAPVSYTHLTLPTIYSV